MNSNPDSTHSELNAETGHTVVLSKEHFDRAVRQMWSTKTCLIAQCAKDYDLIGHDGEIKMVGKTRRYVSPFMDSTSWSLMRAFDRYFRYPGDESKPELVALRESLPITIGVLPVPEAQQTPALTGENKNEK